MRLCVSLSFESRSFNQHKYQCKSSARESTLARAPALTWACHYDCCMTAQPQATVEEDERCEPSAHLTLFPLLVRALARASACSKLLDAEPCTTLTA